MLLVSSMVFAEKSGDAGQIIRETDLFERPYEDAESLGLLPGGSIFIHLGQEKDGFIFIKVELEEGEIEGWVRQNAVDKASRTGEIPEEAEETGDQPTPMEQEKKRLRPANKLVIPRDEGVLIRRERVFLYGIFAGSQFNIIQIDSDEFFYMDWGFNFGGNIGFYVHKGIPVYLEVSYRLAKGTNEEGQLLDFGFLDVGIGARYAIERFEISAALTYSIGIAVGNIPSTITIDTAQDLSSFYAGIGAGYRLQAGEVTSVILGVHWAYALLQAPVHIQYIGAQARLEFGG